MRPAIGDGGGKGAEMENTEKNQQDEILKAVLKLPIQLWGVAYLELMVAAESGRKINDLKAYCAGIVAREDGSCGFETLDWEGEGAHRLHERLAAPQEEEIELWRFAELDESTEKILGELREGAASFGRKRGVSGRRGQQMVVTLLERVERVEGGQDLFGWGG